MINEQIKNQIDLANKAIEEMKSQNRIFDTMIQSALQGAPDDQKKEIQKFQLMTKQALALAKEGKIKESENLIKKFKNGQNN